MERHESRAAQRHNGITTHRAVTLTGTLAIALACLSFWHSGAWISETAVWARAQRVAPALPDPWVHGAMAVLDAGAARDPAVWADAERLLNRARSTLARQSADEQRWAQDAIDATTAVIRMRQGRLIEAAWLMQSPYPASARGQLCAHFRSVCALAASSGS